MGLLELDIWDAFLVILPGAFGLWFMLGGARAVIDPSRLEQNRPIDWLVRYMVREAARRPGYPKNPRLWAWVVLISGIVFIVIAVHEFLGFL
jgi:hypothetical protein